MPSQRVTRASVDRSTEESELEILRWLEADVLAIDERLRVQRRPVITNKTAGVLEKHLTVQLAEEELRSHRTQQSQNARQFQRSRAIDAEHVDRLDVVAEIERTAISRSPP